MRLAVKITASRLWVSLNFFELNYAHFYFSTLTQCFVHFIQRLKQVIEDAFISGFDVYRGDHTGEDIKLLVVLIFQVICIGFDLYAVVVDVAAHIILNGVR